MIAMQFFTNGARIPAAVTMATVAEPCAARNPAEVKKHTRRGDKGLAARRPPK
jgi:hypothetical protein